MIEEILAELGSQMATTVTSLKRDLNRIRTGRASASLLDSVLVNYYGTETALRTIATVSVPEARLLVIQPFDQGSIAAIERAIQTSDLGLSPMSDGKILRVPIPELTADRRRELVKQVRKEGENHRVSARNHRRDAIEMLKQLHTDKEISEDEMRRAQERVEETTKDSIARLDEVIQAKEKEVLAV